MIRELGRVNGNNGCYAILEATEPVDFRAFTHERFKWAPQCILSQDDGISILFCRRIEENVMSDAEYLRDIRLLCTRLNDIREIAEDSLKLLGVLVGENAKEDVFPKLNPDAIRPTGGKISFG